MRRSRKPDSRGELDDATAARRLALGLLARREHSTLELRQKLARRGVPTELVDATLAELTEEGLLSDARYAERLLESHASRGKGPMRVRLDLESRGVADPLIDAALAQAGVDWQALAAKVRRKRFGEACPREMSERARQSRFLHYRGFDSEHIRAALGEDE